MAYTSKQQLYLCCGYYCSMLACVGVYFLLVLFFMEATNSPYLIYEMQMMHHSTTFGDNPDRIATFKWSFLLTSIVSAHYLR